MTSCNIRRWLTIDRNPGGTHHDALTADVDALNELLTSGSPICSVISS